MIWREKKSHFFGDDCQIWLQTQGDLWLCAISRVNHPCSFLGHGGVSWKKCTWTKSWGELSCHHVTYACWILPCSAVFCFLNMIRATSVNVIETALQNSSPPSVLSQKSVYYLKRYFFVLFFNSTVLITFTLLILFVYKCFVYFPKYCLLHALSVNLQCFCLCVNNPLNIMFFFVLCCVFLFFILPLNCWIF